MGWYNSAWLYRKKITIDKDKVSSDQTDFPVLILLALDAELAAKAQDSGNDILFTKSNGTDKLDHEIEKFDGATGELIAWVEVDSLSSLTDTDIYMYYGNAGCADQQNVNGTWDGNYVGVWHLKDDPDNAHVKDSTSKGWNGTKRAAGAPAEIDAKIGKGQDLESDTSDAIDCGDVSELEGEDEITIEVWVKRESDKGTYETIASRWFTPNPLFWFGVAGGVDDKLYFYLNNSIGGGGNTHSDGVIATDGTWYYVVGTWDGSVIKVYVNGNPTGVPGAMAGVWASSAKKFYLGREDTANVYPWDGVMDEARCSITARPAGWILTCWNNQSSPSAFFGLGEEESEAVAVEALDVFWPRKSMPTGYHCFIQQYIKNMFRGRVPFKLPSGEAW